MIITSLFWKLTEVSTNNFKTDIKETSGQLKCAKISFLYKSGFINCEEILCHAALEVLRKHYLNEIKSGDFKDFKFLARLS